ncbi:MAG TPA: IS4 family transposase [Aggregicoccus sp.]|nr:IS4 family transposase [Aggregicoccus sp.]
MRFEEALSQVPAVLPGEFEQFARHLRPEFIEDALCATGTASVRRRRLPAEQVLWLCVGMALMRNESVERVAALLSLALPAAREALVARSALVQARQRLGEEPLAYVFGATGAEWAQRSARAHRWRGLSVYALDGSTLRVPDGRENWAAFGGQVKSGKRAGSAYPTLRVAGLMAARSHVLAGLAFGPYATGEVTLARELWPSVPDDSVTLVDRNFLVAADLNRLVGEGRNRHWVTRLRKQLTLRVLERHARGDERVEVVLSAATRRRCPELPERWEARAVRYQRKGFRPSVLLTSLLDPVAWPRDEVVSLYHERWEIELGYDEVKTHLLMREEALRSRTPEGVRQEVWAVGLAYNLVRLEMERVASEAGVPPTRISFTNALSLIAHAWVVWSTPPMVPGKLPGELLDLRARLRLLLLPERRPERSYPRAVKIKMSNYARKRPRGRGRN